MSISSVLFTSRDALMTNQLAIDIVGGNIANVNTPGYTRQRTDVVSVGGINVGNMSANVGVAVTNIERIYDRFIESQIIEQQQSKGYSDALLQGMQNIEVMLDDTGGGGINDQLNKFWAAWENLSMNPGGTVERNALLSSAQTLTGAIASYKQNLDTLHSDLDRSIEGVVSDINSKISELADLNSQIGIIQSDRGDKNLLLDKKTAVLGELASLTNISYYENADGTVNVYMENGEPLVQGTLVQKLEATMNPATNRTEITMPNTPAGETINSSLTNGKLGAYIELQGTVIISYISNINEVASTLASSVNALHRTGFDADKSTGLDFFTIDVDPNKAAATISVNSVIAANVNRIAASASVSGDGENATRLASIRDELLMDTGNTTLSSFLTAMVGDIGRQTANAKTNSDHQDAIMNYLSNQRESVSGVSIDEEMILMIKFQMGYTAAGKLCSMVNDMMDTLMNIAS